MLNRPSVYKTLFIHLIKEASVLKTFAGTEQDYNSDQTFSDLNTKFSKVCIKKVLEVQYPVLTVRCECFRQMQTVPPFP